MRDVRMRGFGQRTSVAEALDLLAQLAGVLGSERALLGDAAGRVAAADVVASVSVPHFPRAAMDGYAVVAESTFGATDHTPVILRVSGESLPGRPSGRRLAKGEAERIATGAPVPEGGDAVVRAEQARMVVESHIAGTASSSAATIEITRPVSPGKDVGAIGEDVLAGTRLVSAGRMLRPQDLGVLSSAGVGALDVVRRPRISVVITGDEILEPGQPPCGSRIPDANGPMLSALAGRDGAGAITVERVGDGRYEVASAMRGAAAVSDVVLVSGGSSVGPEDHAPSILGELGEILVHGVAMRPASPAGFGRLFVGDHARPSLVFLLPGNPVSALAAYELFAGPAIRGLGGRSMEWPHRRVRAPLARKIESELGRTDYVRVALEQGRVVPIMTSGASILSSTTRADGVVIVDAPSEGHAEGETVEVRLYD